MRKVEGEISRIEAEKFADSMAIELGLGHDMVSALRKMIDSGNYKDVRDDMISRIAELEEQATQ